MKMPCLLLALWLSEMPGLTAGNLVANGDFEEGASGWRTWAREPTAISTSLDPNQAHAGKSAIRIQHRGEQDWSLEPDLTMAVRAGDLIELECWVKIQGAGRATLCASIWDAAGKAVSWTAGERTAEDGPAWQPLRTRVVVPRGIVRLQPRMIGHGPATVWVDDYSVVPAGNVLESRPPDLPPTLTLRNGTLEVRLDTRDATFSVLDTRTARRWIQRPFSADCVVKNAEITPAGLRCALLHAPTGLDVAVTARLEGEKPEVLMELAASGDMPAKVSFPHPFQGETGDFLVVPLNEGISYPVDDPDIPSLRLIAYGGHGLCMAFFGLTDGTQGQMTILETPDDAAIRIERMDGRLAILPEWEAQRGTFGYTRTLRWVFSDRGGHVAMAKRYRAYARQIGLLKTLDQKRRQNPNVDLLIGAVNVWCWDREAPAIASEMQSAGIDRILWSNRQSPENLEALNRLGVLTSRYDIYQDVMAPTNFPRLQWIHPDWTTNAWPQDVIRDRRGRWIHGWGVEARDGTLIPCSVLCDRQALAYARERIPAELAAHPYRCRFIDTTTAAPWHECYAPDHPMTRTESRRWKMELLRYVSEDQLLVTGSETGHDAAVPYVHYFEGMLSLGPYRVPDAGRRMSEIWTNVPPDLAKFQLGHAYRLPLWELVYHDCVVAQWYWGDYNNKLPALWDKRDLFNVLYGTPPMFMFNRTLWSANKARFVRSYLNTGPHVRRVGTSEMTDHRFLAPDRSVQQTVFANGVQVTVNFGANPFTLPSGAVVEPMGFRVDP
ncbi:MAG TPA: glycoside hydrolase [Verrucomicrobiota bacterium]|nr:glycoside hydrolase [Verrucomicrobiota bacterium]HNU52394.1 glycoside hydrolase [Verrucomicrobiota bacterium]